jgi:transketolase
MNTGTNIDLIREKAAAMRRDCLEMGYAAGSHGAHFGPALSSIEIVASLYFGIMNHDPQNPCLLERDRFVMSKGHACLSYYAALVEAGYLSREEMYTFKGDNSILSGHPSCHVEHGLEVGDRQPRQWFCHCCGMAMAAIINRETHTGIAYWASANVMKA